MKTPKNLKIGKGNKLLPRNKNTFQFRSVWKALSTMSTASLWSYSQLAGNGVNQVGIYIVAKT